MVEDHPSDMPDGNQATPKTNAEKLRAWREKNREAYNAYMKEYRKKHDLNKQRQMTAEQREEYNRNVRERRKKNPEKYKAANKKWNDKNRQKLFAYYQKWRKQNKKQIKALDRKWRATEAGRRARQACEQRRRARKKNAGGTITAKQWLEILKQYKYRCYWCNRVLRRGNRTMDHVIPLCRGGQHCPENVVPACRRCNFRKARSLPEDFKQRLSEEQRD